MKFCTKCNHEFVSNSWECPACKNIFLIEDEVAICSKNQSLKSDGFEEGFFSRLYKTESNFFWFKARNKLILSMMQKYFSQKLTFMEVGCGTGFVLSAIEKQFSDWIIYGSEIYLAGLQFAKKRVIKSSLIQMDATNIPFKEEFDLIGSFDVLEHIEDDMTVLKQFNKALKPRGHVILTVPNHKFLWSKTDEFSHHFRRYNQLEIVEKLRSTGFCIKTITGFVITLLPLMVLSRFFFNKAKNELDLTKEVKINKFLNVVLELILNLENILIKRGVKFSFGSSLLVIAEKVRNV